MGRVRRVERRRRIFDRENGGRFLLSIVGEIAFEQEWNVYFVLEGAPFQQAERALFTNLFSGAMPTNDYRIYSTRTPI